MALILVMFIFLFVAGFLYGPALMPLKFLGDSAQGFIGIATAYPFVRMMLYRFPHMRTAR